MAGDRRGQRAPEAVPRAARASRRTSGPTARSTCRRNCSPSSTGWSPRCTTAFDRSPTERILAAIDHPHVDCIGHLTGRKLNRRAGADVDVERVVARAVGDRDCARDQQPAGPTRPARRPRAAGRRGGRPGAGHDRRALDERRSATASSASPRRAARGSRRIRSSTRGRGARSRSCGSEHLPGGRRGCARVGGVLPRAASRELPGALAGRARRDPRRAPRSCPRGAGAVLRRSPRPRRRAHARPHPLAEPALLRLLRDDGSEPGILAELLVAALNQVGILWRASPALQELEEVTLEWLADLLGLPDGMHGHIEDTASTGLVTALAAARAATPGKGSSSAPSTRTRRRRRRRGCSSSS